MSKYPLSLENQVSQSRLLKKLKKDVQRMEQRYTDQLESKQALIERQAGTITRQMLKIDELTDRLCEILERDEESE